MARVYLSLGSNQQPERHLAAALAELRRRFGPLQVSAAYRFPAVGFSGAAFVNLAAVIETDLAPEALNAWLHALEDRHGRRRDVPRFSDRTLDIDIVLYDDAVLEGSGNLQVPRDELRHSFVLRPLAEIAPEAVVPTSGLKLGQLWRQHADHGSDFERVELEEPAATAS
jgi:2-amino-4-hydroxy-6-hydroxymethyldihydropteridine diphosphokinase